MKFFKIPSRLTANLSRRFHFQMEENNVKDGSMDQNEGKAMAQTTTKAPSTGASAPQRPQTKDAPSTKGLHFTDAQAAKIRKVQDSLTAGRKGGKLFGLKD